MLKSYIWFKISWIKYLSFKFPKHQLIKTRSSADSWTITTEINVVPIDSESEDALFTIFRDQSLELPGATNTLHCG